jgi:hypothetical protein
MTEQLSGWKLALAYGQLAAAIYGATPDQVKEYLDANAMSQPLHQTQLEAAQAQLDELGEQVKALLDAQEIDRGEKPDYPAPEQTTELVVEVEDPVASLLARVEEETREADAEHDKENAQAEIEAKEEALAEIHARQTQDLEEQLASIDAQYTEGHQGDSPEEKEADKVRLAEAAEQARAELEARQAAERERLEHERLEHEQQAPTRE